MGEDFVVDTSYPGYVFVGWAAGRFENEKGEKTPYANMFVLSPVSSYESEDYKAFGLKAENREQYQQEHRSELAAFDAAADFLKRLKESSEAITPKAWRAEAAKLAAQKDVDYTKMRAMRDEIKAVESLRKTADSLAHEGQHQQRETER